jgi:tetratricopeptide (TPR) repeat protein
MMKNYRKYISLLLCLSCVAACKKDFLDIKPNKALLIPTTTADLRTLLDNNFLFNKTPGLTVLADGDFFTNDAGYNGYFSDEERRSYVWAADIFGINTEGEWNAPFKAVFYANVVLEALDKLPPRGSDPAQVSELRGAALFHRAFSIYHLAQQFARPYQPATAGTDPGIPYKRTPVVTDNVGRGTVAGTYTKMLEDLKAARQLLPPATANKSRPNRAAAYAMLAKVYLAMGDYPQAGRYADSCLQQQSVLINYNTLSTTAIRPFPKVLPNGNDEVIFYAIALDYSFTGTNTPTVAEPSLYASYAANDLRKVVFFRALAPGFKFKGNYAGILSQFSGLATDEMYLVRAECAARSGNTAAAMTDLNKLLLTRWKTGTYLDLTAADADAALQLVLTERRKELVGRGIRWGDLRRLNSDPRFAVTLTRQILGSTYTLEAGSRRYVYPIPQDEIKLTGIEQNGR